MNREYQQEINATSMEAKAGVNRRPQGKNADNTSIRIGALETMDKSQLRRILKSQSHDGWHYAVDGSCTRIPSLPAGHTIPTKARARAYLSLDG